MTSYDGTTITYDGVGNPLTDGTWTYTWQNGRELASMTSGSTTWSYTYDANGMRTGRTNDTVTYSYVYNGGSLSQMTKGGSTLNFFYDASGSPTMVTYNGTTYYYVTNLQGDIVSIRNASGTAVVNYTYDAWGKPLSVTGSMASNLGTSNPLRYRSYVYDQETGLYYLQSRYYDPEIGRFINADAFASTGQGLLGNNMFAYCLNNPVCYADGTGMFPWLITALIIITVGGCTYGATTDENLSEAMSPPKEDKPNMIIRPAPAPRPEIGGNIIPSSPILALPAPPEEGTSSQNTDNSLSTTERVNNMIIGGTVALMIGGAGSILGGAIACMAGSSTVLLPVLGLTGKQAVAWGILSYDIFPIFIAPFFGMEMESLEYPS